MTTIDPTVSAEPLASNTDPATVNSELRPHLHVHSVTLTGLFILAVLFTLHLGRVIFLPITIALLFAVLFAPLLRRLKQVKIPEPVGAAILLSLLVAILGYGVSRLAEPASDWAKGAGRCPRSRIQASSLQATDAGSDEGHRAAFQGCHIGRDEKSSTG